MAHAFKNRHNSNKFGSLQKKLLTKHIMFKETLYKKTKRTADNG